MYPSGGSAAADVQIGVSTYSTSNTAFRWYMNPTSDITDQILIYDKKTGECVTTPTVHVKPQETRSLSDAGIEMEFVTLSANRQLQFTSAQPSKIAINSTTGAITGVTSMSTVVVTVSGSNGTAAPGTFVVQCSPYRIDLDVQYDGGYVTRYMSEALTAVERINAHTPALWKFYLETFGAEVVASTPEQFESLADMCNSEHYYDECACGDCKQSEVLTGGTVFYSTVHHKNVVNNIFHQTRTPLTTRQMLFLGHEMCERDSPLGNCYPVLSNGIAREADKICAVYTFTSIEEELLTVLHEFGHLIGAVDHYGGGNVPSTDDMNEAYDEVDLFKTLCVFGEAKYSDNDEHSSLVNNPVICDGCKQMIQTYLSENCS